MTVKLAPHEIVAASVAGLGYELVDFEHSARGLMRVFIDKAAGIGVEQRRWGHLSPRDSRSIGAVGIKQ